MTMCVRCSVAEEACLHDFTGTIHPGSCTVLGRDRVTFTKEQDREFISH